MGLDKQEDRLQAFGELFAAIERQYGPIEYVTICSSFEDSPEFHRIAGIGQTTQCEAGNCGNLSVSLCDCCGLAVCQEHSHTEDNPLIGFRNGKLYEAGDVELTD